jgi:hypothetical protein
MKASPYRVAAVTGLIIFCPNIWLTVKLGSEKLILLSILVINYYFLTSVVI